MTTDSAALTIWNYMLMHQPLQKSDVIFVLGNSDTRVGEYAAQLYLDGWAPTVLFTGSGSIHNHKPGRERFIGTTEADVFADVAIKMGVPKEAIIVENGSQSTGDNFKFGIQKMKERGINPQRIIIVQKPYMERRAYAAAVAHIPGVEIIVTSPAIPFEKYQDEFMTKDHMMNSMVGDLQRIREYPKFGFQIEQEIPADVWEAYEFLVKEGYTKKLIKE